MRYIIYGAGAVGGVIGARLAQRGHDVVLIARGAHLDAIRDARPRARDAATRPSRCRSPPPATRASSTRARRRRPSDDEDAAHGSRA